MALKCAAMHNTPDSPLSVSIKFGREQLSHRLLVANMYCRKVSASIEHRVRMACTGVTVGDSSDSFEVNCLDVCLASALQSGSTL